MSALWAPTLPVVTDAAIRDANARAAWRFLALASAAYVALAMLSGREFRLPEQSVLYWRYAPLAGALVGLLGSFVVLRYAPARIGSAALLVLLPCLPLLLSPGADLSWRSGALSEGDNRQILALSIGVWAGDLALAAILSAVLLTAIALSLGLKSFESASSWSWKHAVLGVALGAPLCLVFGGAGYIESNFVLAAAGPVIGGTLLLAFGSHRGVNAPAATATVIGVSIALVIVSRTFNEAVTGSCLETCFSCMSPAGRDYIAVACTKEVHRVDWPLGLKAFPALWLLTSAGLAFVSMHGRFRRAVVAMCLACSAAFAVSAVTMLRWQQIRTIASEAIASPWAAAENFEPFRAEVFTRHLRADMVAELGQVRSLRTGRVLTNPYDAEKADALERFFRAHLQSVPVDPYFRTTPVPTLAMAPDARLPSASITAIIIAATRAGALQLDWVGVEPERASELPATGEVAFWAKRLYGHRAAARFAVQFGVPLSHHGEAGAPRGLATRTMGEYDVSSVTRIVELADQLDRRDTQLLLLQPDDPWARPRQADAPPDVLFDAFSCDFAVLDVVLGHRKALQSCVNAEHRRLSDSHGTVTLSWRIDEHGRPIDVRNEAKTGADVERCFVEAVQGMRFPVKERPADQRQKFPFKY